MVTYLIILVLNIYDLLTDFVVNIFKRVWTYFLSHSKLISVIAI